MGIICWAVESTQFVQTRTSVAREAYTQLLAFMHQFYIFDGAGVCLTLGKLSVGMSIVIMQYTGSVRGERVHVDHDGYCDV